MPSSAGASIGAAILLAFTPGASAFLPATSSLPRGLKVQTFAVSNGVDAVVRRQPRSSSALKMFDEATLIGGAAALAGCGCGIGACLFMERSAERTEEKGALSDEARMKYSAKFMEDDNATYRMQGGVDVDDLTARMRAALRDSKTAEERAADEEKELQAASVAAKEEDDDGW